MFKKLLQNFILNCNLSSKLKCNIHTLPSVLNVQHKYNHDDEKVGTKYTVNKLEELFKIRRHYAQDIASQCKKLCSVKPSNIEENYNILLKEDINSEDMLKHPEVLSESALAVKLKYLKSLPYDINITLPLLCLSRSEICFLISDEMHQQRIKVLSRLLECDVSQTCKFLSNRTFLIKINLKQVKENIKVLKEFGVDIEDIKGDLWVLKYAPSHITERLSMAKDNNIDTMKTWMVRAKLSIFDTYIKRRSDNKSVLGDSSLVQYLSKKLNCNEQTVQQLIYKHPALKSKSLIKTEEIINFLYGYGFKPEHICKVPKILLHSVATTKKRLSELASQGMHIDSLYLLTKSQKQYLNYYENLVKANRCKNKES